MKIRIYDETQGWLGAVPVKIKDASSELQKITVRVRHFKIFDIKRPVPGATPMKRQPTRSLPNIKVSPTRASKEPQTPIRPPANDAIKSEGTRLALPALPKMHTIAEVKIRLKTIPKKTFVIAAVVCAVVVVSIVSYGQFAPHHTNTKVSNTAADTASSSGTPELVKGTPSFPTVLPAGKTIAELGGWTRVSPPDRDPVYTYVDKIDNVEVDVSEQPLPANFQHDTANQVAQLAQGFSANDKLTAGSTNAYVGTSAKGPQSVIFSKSNLLILIKSSSPIADNKWVAYVNSLQ